MMGLIIKKRFFGDKKYYGDYWISDCSVFDGLSIKNFKTKWEAKKYMKEFIRINR